jgi:hypothetical protein
MDTGRDDSVKLSVRQMNKVVRRLRLRNNDVVLVKSGTDMTSKDNMDALANSIGNSGLDGIILVVVDDMGDIDNISEKEMAEHGWVKIGKAVSKMIVKKGGSNEQDNGEKSV